MTGSSAVLGGALEAKACALEVKAHASEVWGRLCRRKPRRTIHRRFLLPWIFTFDSHRLCRTFWCRTVRWRQRRVYRSSATNANISYNIISQRWLEVLHVSGQNSDRLNFQARSRTKIVIKSIRPRGWNAVCESFSESRTKPKDFDSENLSFIYVMLFLANGQSILCMLLRLVFNGDEMHKQARQVKIKKKISEN